LTLAMLRLSQLNIGLTSLFLVLQSARTVALAATDVAAAAAAVVTARLVTAQLVAAAAAPAPPPTSWTSLPSRPWARSAPRAALGTAGHGVACYL